MAGQVRYTAVLDACVLYPIAMCDTLLSVAATNLYAPKWSARIDDEWMGNLEANTNKPPGTFISRRDHMRRAFPDWQVSAEAIAELEPCLKLPDENDRHVLAAAIVGHADCIVTTNLDDFPESALGRFGIEALHPDDFLVAQFDLDPYAVLTALKTMRLRAKNPALTSEAFVDLLHNRELVALSARVREAIDLV